MGLFGAETRGLASGRRSSRDLKPWGAAGGNSVRRGRSRPRRAGGHSGQSVHPQQRVRAELAAVQWDPSAGCGRVRAKVPE